MILFLTNDLMIQSKAVSSAKRCGVQLRSASSLDELFKKLANEKIDALLIDLQSPGVRVDELISKLTDLETKIPCIAFAQHVEEELLATARSEIFEAVLTRGQFANRLPRLVQQYGSKTALD